MREVANSFVGKTIPTTGDNGLDVAELNSEFKEVVNKWFGANTLTEDLFEAGVDNKVALKSGIDLNRVFSYGTFIGKVYQTMTVGEVTFDADGIDAFFAAFSAELAKVDGVPTAA